MWFKTFMIVYIVQKVGRQQFTQQKVKCMPRHSRVVGQQWNILNPNLGRVNKL